MKTKKSQSKTRSPLARVKKPNLKIKERVVNKSTVINSDFSRIKTCQPMKKRCLITSLIVFLIIVSLLYFFKNQFLVALINNKPIWRFTVISELEKQGGKEILDSIITRSLVLQEIKKQNIVVTDEELNQELKKIEESLSQQGQDINELLKSQGLDKKSLATEIKIKKSLEKIVGKDIKVTDEEVNDYAEKNKSFIPSDLSSEEVKTEVRKQLEQQKMNEEIQSLVKSLREKAKIYYLRYL